MNSSARQSNETLQPGAIMKSAGSVYPELFYFQFSFFLRKAQTGFVNTIFPAITIKYF